MLPVSSIASANGSALSSATQPAFVLKGVTVVEENHSLLVRAQSSCAAYMSLCTREASKFIPVNAR